MTQIEFHQVSYRYFTPAEETEALRNVSFLVHEGELISIVGPSGCGKSTLLSLISGMAFPNEGTVTVFGKQVKEASPRIGYMLQHDHLFAWRDVLNNLLVGAEIRGINRQEAKKTAVDLLKRYRLEQFAHYTPISFLGVCGNE